MAKRRKIGLIYQYNENWIGGTYYVENLISALNHLSDQLKPWLIIYTDDENQFFNLGKKIEYPYLKNRTYIRSLSFFEKAVNKVYRNVSGKNYFFPFYNDVDIIFPAKNEHRFLKEQKFLYWIPDFQEHFYPEFFSEKEIWDRRSYQQTIINNAKFIVFSSETVKKHFNQIYPTNCLKQFVVRFAVTHHPANDNADLNERLQLPKHFFLCSNQFWKHKNHIVILEALQILKHKGLEAFVVFTGKNHDYRHPEYFDELIESSIQMGIEKNINFIGFIDRVDQLSLMKKSLAVIQPSLFEGWSTVVEDAKSLGVNIIASDIDVHKEQLLHYKASRLFSALDKSDLALKMEEFNHPKSIEIAYDYNKDVKAFAISFASALDNIFSEK